MLRPALHPASREPLTISIDKKESSRDCDDKSLVKQNHSECNLTSDPPRIPSDGPAKKLRRSIDDHPKDTLNTQKGFDGNLEFQNVSQKLFKCKSDIFPVPDLDMSANEVQETAVSSSSSTEVLQTDKRSSEGAGGIIGN